jgi:hypothetical protein
MVTIQQMGNHTREAILEMMNKGADVKPVGFVDQTGALTKQGRLLDEKARYKFTDPDFPGSGANFYRSDDVSAAAYFYLDKPENNLPELPPVDIRLKYLKEMVWKFSKK